MYYLLLLIMSTSFLTPNTIIFTTLTGVDICSLYITPLSAEISLGESH